MELNEDKPAANKHPEYNSIAPQRPKRTKCNSIYRRESLLLELGRDGKDVQNVLPRKSSKNELEEKSNSSDGASKSKRDLKCKPTKIKSDVKKGVSRRNRSDAHLKQVDVLSNSEKTKGVNIDGSKDDEKVSIIQQVDIDSPSKVTGEVDEPVREVQSCISVNEKNTSATDLDNPQAQTLSAASVQHEAEITTCSDSTETNTRKRKKAKNSIRNDLSCETGASPPSLDQSDNKALLVGGNKCPYCAFIYGCPRFLAPHIMDEHQDLIKANGLRLSYKCLYCDQWCTRPRKILLHMHRRHSEKFPRDDLEKTLKFRCDQPDCSLPFISEIKLNKHLASEHKIMVKLPRIRNYNADHLQDRAEKVALGEVPLWGSNSSTSKHKASALSTEFHLSTRIRDCHPACWTIARERGMYKCGFCDKVFPQHSQCVVHESAHEIVLRRDGLKDLKCSKCSEQFPDLDLLSRHETEVHKKSVNKMFQCGECGKFFASSHYVKKHVDTVHLKKSKFHCNICGKAYRQRPSLNRHKFIQHGGPDKPRGKRTCELCGSVFKSREGFKSHMLKHSGIKPFSCRYCSRMFFARTHLRTHEYIHTGLKVHHCPVCSRLFTNQGSLHNHLYRYAVHGTLPKIHKFDDGSSRKAFDEALQSLRESGKLKHATLGPRKRSKKNTQKSTPRNLGLDTLAQVAGMVNGLVVDQNTFEEQTQTMEVLINEESNEPSNVNVDISNEGGPSDPLHKSSPDVQIVAVDGRLEDTHIDLPEGHQVLVIVPREFTSLSKGNPTWLTESRSENKEGDVSYIQINMNQDDDVNVVEQYMASTENVGTFCEYPLSQQSEHTSVEDEQIFISVNDDLNDPEIDGENLTLSTETQYVVVTEDCGPHIGVIPDLNCK